VISLILKNYPSKSTDPSTRPAQVTGDESPISFGFVPPSEKLKPVEQNPMIGSIPSQATLIICPLSTVYNWEDQIYTHARRGALKVLIYHGPNRSTNAGYIAKHDVVITTYNIIGMNFQKKGITPLHAIFWHRIVLDEAHIIKSSSTVQAKSAFEFEAVCRWCLTGTPLQNKLDGT
jgi:SWI/SNF-related matrix-associated actin-dependent regulator of chromatin subfamily A3